MHRLLNRAIFFLLLILVNQGQSQECKKSEMKINMRTGEKCLKEMGVEGARNLGVEKAPCFVKCVLSEEKLLDEKGFPHKDNIHRDLESEGNEKLLQRIDKCIEDHHPEIKPDEVTCKSYIPFWECLNSALTKSCSS